MDGLELIRGRVVRGMDGWGGLIKGGIAGATVSDAEQTVNRSVHSVAAWQRATQVVLGVGIRILILPVLFVRHI